MKTLLGGIVAALLLLNSTAFASHPAPGVQVIVKNGGTTVFRGVTDGSGKFYTPPLAPGTYLFDVRGPKVLAPNRYFLALAGARPLGETMTNAAGDLAMQAEVRQGKSVRGQVRAFRVLRNPLPVDPALASASSASGTGFQNAPVPTGPSGYAAPSAQWAATNSSAAMSNAARVQPTPRPLTTSTTAARVQSTSRPVATSTAVARVQPTPRPLTTSTTAARVQSNSRPVATSPAVARVQPTPRVATARSATRTAAVPPAARPPVTRQMSTTAAVPAKPSVASSAVPLPLIIGGKRYIWMPTTAGSTVGRWVLDKRQPSVGTGAPVKRPIPTPTPSRSR